MREIPFKVSARAARLIGAENIANAESAVIELIKNSYDADAETCLVYFEHVFNEIPSHFDKHQFDYLNASPSFENFSRHFKNSSNSSYKIEIALNDEDKKKETTKDELYDSLIKWLSNLCRIWIIDDGHGMDEQTIEENWMTIGTNNKEKSPVTKKLKRIKSGAKGLGRFALDKLGSLSNVYISPDIDYFKLKEENSCLEWFNKWENFLEEGKTLDNVKAILDYKFLDKSFHQQYLPSEVFTNELNINFHNYGVIICCDYNKENWYKERQKRLRDSLETLIPPTEKDNFSLFFVSNRFGDLNKKVSSAITSNYDYKVIARLGNDNSVIIDIDRNEFEVSEFPDEFFKSDGFQNLNTTIEEFKAGKIRHTLKLKNLFPKVEEFALGSFSMSFYFSKQGTPSKKDSEKFHYKTFDLTSRKSWSDTFGGIRIFRDNFRVRPYGEPGAAKDWLGLGDRSASSPAGIGKGTGGWRVRPNQISGVINISRVNNPSLADKSSREGIQENDEFAQFKSVILKILETFENDRAEIGAVLKAIADKNDQEAQKEEQANTISRQILKESSKNDNNNSENVVETPEQNNLKLLASQYEKKKEQIEELMEEQKILRSLATIGTISSSFSHDLKLLHGKLVKRFIPVQKVLEKNHQYSVKNNLEFTAGLSDSLERIDMFKKQDSSVKDWINFSLLGVKKDKRRRRKVYLENYLNQLQKAWNKKFDDGNIIFNIESKPKDSALKCFEIDLDCIFNNLVVNSVEAFSQKDAPPIREINIKIRETKEHIIIVYSDSGPGLSKDIVNPQRIFQCFFTTKINEHSGEEEGTGIGMWMVKSTINEYRGSTKLLLDKSGFGLEIQIPKNI